MRNIKSVNNVLKKLNKKPAYRRPKTVFGMLKNVKDSYAEKQKSGVYQVEMNNLDSGQREVYIGATVRNLEDKIAEHKRDIKKGNLTTALARRAYECNLEIDWNRTRVIK